MGKKHIWKDEKKENTFFAVVFKKNKEEWVHLFLTYFYPTYSNFYPWRS